MKQGKNFQDVNDKQFCFKMRITKNTRQKTPNEIF